MAIGSPQWMYASGEAYELEQSLKFNDDDSAYLSWTPTSAGNRKTWTFSSWSKRGNIDTSEFPLLAATTDANNRFYFRFEGNLLKVYWNVAGTSNEVVTTALYRDTSSWYHVVLAVDTTQGTDTNRIKVYVNGIQQTLTGTYIPQNTDTQINLNVAQLIGKKDTAATYFDGYLAEVNFIDGQALTPADFGETGDYGEWKPKEYSGTYGTNGFYLPFKQDYSVEGFSTVLWKGTDVPQYIGGVGFQPDMLWVKSRTSAHGHVLVDSLRGNTQTLIPNATDAEYGSSMDTIDAFSSDGFTVGADGGTNSNGASFVAWNWDMDSSTRTKLNISAEGTAKHVTAQSKVPASSSSIYTPSGNANYVQLGSDGDIDFGSDNFTIEFWVKDGSGYFLSGYGGTHSIYIQQTGSSAGTIYINTSGGDGTISISPTWSNWVHIAIVRNSNTFTAYIDGTSAGTLTLSGTVSSSAYRLGRNGTDTADGSGYFDELRISNTARYTGNFTAPTTAFSEDANTLMLIHSLAPNNQTYILDGGSISTAGSINSSVMANPTYGQSIVSYTGNATAGATVGHGLSSAPEMIILKDRDGTTNWNVYHASNTSAPETEALALNTTDATSDYLWWNDTAPTSSVFSLGAISNTNANGNNFIAYLWHSVTGYSKFGSYTGNGSATGTVVTTGFSPAFVMIKVADRTDGGSGGWFMYDNTRSPYTAQNHALMAQSSAAELVDNSNVAIDFLSTGFQLKASYDEINVNGGTYIYMAFADKREYAYWLDQSGNNNDWTSNNLTESDISVDSPTNNFCTWNPLDKSSSQTLSEGNLVSDSTVNDAWKGVRGTFGISSGKWYWEYLKTNTYLHSTVGIAIADAELDVSTALSGITDWWMYSSYNGAKIGNGSETSYGATYQAVGDVVGIALDMDNGTLTFYKNGVSQGQAFNSGLSSKTVYPYRLAYNSADLTVANFGQDSSFAGNKTAQGNQDGNDIGDFYYTPPTGFLALCTKNLPDVAVTPSEHFNTVTYSGNGATSHAITGLGFQPDFNWIKRRNGTNSHALHDSVRGKSGSNYLYLSSNATNAEAVQTDEDGVHSFDSDGFTVGYNGSGLWNNSSGTYVAWNWNCPDTFTPTVTSGLTSASGRSNAAAGFSIVKVTADSNISNSSSYTHNLGVAPEMIIQKRIDSTDNWNSYHKDLGGAGKFIELNTTNAVQDASNVFEETPTSTVVKPCTNIMVNGATHIFYNFASVDGYSKVGSYTGNGNADGTFVYTGFRPAMIIIKEADNVNDWHLIDYKREAELGNPVQAWLRPNSSDVEASADNDIDIVSNGFKARSTGNRTNRANGTLIYIAFAETPFKYSNAR